jgi:hypothetical protein
MLEALHNWQPSSEDYERAKLIVARSKSVKHEKSREERLRELTTVPTSKVKLA